MSSIPRLAARSQELQALLSKFGWCSGRGFTRIVDVKGLQAALQKYQFVKLGPIGNGAYGSVHKVMNRETRELLGEEQGVKTRGCYGDIARATPLLSRTVVRQRISPPLYLPPSWPYPLIL